MREYQERRKFKKIIYSKWSYLFLSAIIVFIFYSTIGVYRKSRNNLAQNKEEENKLAALEKRNAELENEIIRMESESGKEEEIRKKFNVAKQGEKILVIVDKKPKDVKMENTEKKSGILSRFWQSVKGLFK